MTINHQVVAILRGITPPECEEQVACLLENGISSIEITTNSPDWVTSLARVRARFGRNVRLGAGTVLTPDQVAQCAAEGADFILTPNLDPCVVAAAKRLGLQVCAGVFTSSEIFYACELGVDVLKIFPAAALPPDYPQWIKGPLSQPALFSAVGGVNIDNAAAFLRHYDSVGIGSSLYRPGQTVDVTVQRCRQLLHAGQ